MSKAISYALLVEGPVNASGDERATFDTLWTEYLTSLNSTLPHIIVPIHKPHLVAMDPSLPTMSGASEALDHLIARIIKVHNISAIAIAWDLTPPWDPDAEEAKYCRWNETKKLYDLLAQSMVLPTEWKESCRARWVELAGRAQPGDRAGPFTLEEHAVVPICMEPEFEGLLVQNERQIMRAVGLAKIPAQHWPKRWGAAGQNPKTLLAKAVVAARKAKPKPAPVKRIHRTALALIGHEVTVVDAKARRDLGYTSHVSREQGLAEMRGT